MGIRRGIRQASRRLARSAIGALVIAMAWSHASLAAALHEVFAHHSAGSEVTIDHAPWSALLSSYVKPDQDGLNRVDYRAFKANGHRSLKAYLAKLEAVDPSRLDRREQFAYWANLYNAKTIDVVLDHYPVDSIRKINIGGGFFDALKSTVGAGGPWKAKIMTVGGVRLSLDDIEHGIMRPIFKDPRVHYSVNCASVGCPNLGTEAFTGQKLEVQLDAAAVAFVNHPRGVSVTASGVVASSIYQWFVADFGSSDARVLDHLRSYAKPELKTRLANATSIGRYEYDWSLNDTGR